MQHFSDTFSITITERGLMPKHSIIDSQNYREEKIKCSWFFILIQNSFYAASTLFTIACIRFSIKIPLIFKESYLAEMNPDYGINEENVNIDYSLEVMLSGLYDVIELLATTIAVIAFLSIGILVLAIYSVIVIDSYDNIDIKNAYGKILKQWITILSCNITLVALIVTILSNWQG